MIIREEQFTAFGAYAEDAFVKEMCVHLRSFAPKLCQVAGEPALLHITKSRIERGRSYGLSNRGPLRFFLELTCTLGTGFDTDPQLKWASDVLTDKSIETDMLRAGQLYGRMISYLDQVAGPNQQYAIDALKRLLDYNLDAPHEAWSQSSTTEAMARFYPQKFEFVGESAMRKIMRQAAKEASGYGLPPGEGTAVLSAMKFAMGHLICQDPFYPWISATLNDPLTIDGNGRLARLVSKLRTYGSYVLAHFSRS